MFGTTTVFYALFLPIIVVQLFCILILPSVLRAGSKPEEVGRASYCYLAQAIGVLMMAGGGLPALYAILASQPLMGMSYTGLLLVFAIGGVVFLAQDLNLRSVDAASRMIPGTIFFYTWKFLGLLALLFAAGGLVLHLATGEGNADSRWWVFYVVLLVFGGILSWFTQLPRHQTPAFQRSSMIATAMSVPATASVKKGSATKKKKR